ncbi:hypothetical protein P154DRAFT_560917 [Amniculicola lignicola CBS 123094]|uniref:Uncharacterized protein n=1 Tax=Amniculicola lignicola CBS 123094 TaxID=1392246 RepID=A0A6A5WQH2_9PLEO|nr:hypothetical protein P154DRAFT_560917 [Amniculicola lignicola CBS 123094]
MSDLPSYAEASNANTPYAPPRGYPPQSPEEDSSANPPAEDPPAYTLLDATQTTFSLHGTFIHTPAGPAYQISSPLDQRGVYFRVRRLRAKEVTQVGVSPVPFDKSAILYEVNDPPLLDNEVHMRGFRRTCLPGVLHLKYTLGKWRVKHIPRAGAKGEEILSLRKSSGLGAFSAKMRRGKEEERAEWKDAAGKAVGTEWLTGDEEGGYVPMIELEEGLDQTWREVVLALWAARLWVAVGEEKTSKTGRRLANVRRVAGPSVLN